MKIRFVQKVGDGSFQTTVYHDDEIPSKPVKGEAFRRGKMVMSVEGCCFDMEAQQYIVTVRSTSPNVTEPDKIEQTKARLVKMGWTSAPAVSPGPLMG